MRTLREWRHVRLMSIIDLAERAGVSNKTISDIENGNVTRPANKTKKALCETLDVTPDQVVEFMPRSED